MLMYLKVSNLINSDIISSLMLFIELHSPSANSFGLRSGENTELATRHLKSHSPHNGVGEQRRFLAAVSAGWTLSLNPYAAFIGFMVGILHVAGSRSGYVFTTITRYNCQGHIDSC